MNRRFLALFCVVSTLLCGVVSAEAWLVKDGKAAAEIVVAEQPRRTVKVAARELQEHIEKITGAKLPVVTRPTGGAARVFVGRSPYTDKLGVTAEGLRHDAYRVVSGGDWLALIGDDADFVPVEPYAHSRPDGKRVIKEWDALTGETWGNRKTATFKGYNKELDIWIHDGRGSLNAVYDFLRGLGCRWYFPGEIGEVIPKNASVAIPKADKTVRPDFPCRNILQYFTDFYRGEPDIVDEVKWQLRLGLNSGHRLMGGRRAHGITEVHSRPEVKKKHPEFFALWGGKRAFDHHHGDGAPCLSSEGLLKSNVAYARALYDTYDEAIVSVAPVDGYVYLCGCDKCKPKITPERGWQGQGSDYVWSYVDRVARELYKTHPDKRVSCIAYGSYLLPPEKIEKLSPNVAVFICRWRSRFGDPETLEQYRTIRRGWLEKLTSKELYIYDYYLHGRPGTSAEGVPVYFPRVIAQDLKELKGVSKGDFIEVYRNPPGKKFNYHALATNHLNLYVTARLYWDADQSVDAMLDDYCEKFYGPAAGPMKAFVEYAEANWAKASGDVKIIDRLFELLAPAQAAAGDSIYGRRVKMIADYMERLRLRREQIAKRGQDVPKARAYRRAKKDIKMDGKLDEEFWQGMNIYNMSELQTGRKPGIPTNFRVAWADDSLYFGVKCHEFDPKSIKIGTRKNDDPDIWMGDTVEIMLETQTHAWYQIAINPAGAVMDLDRKRGLQSRWESGAEVAIHVGEDFWSMEVRIPVAGEDAEAMDALAGVSGRRPTKVYPWFFNVCRQRVRDTGTDLSAYSPTGTSRFAAPLKFAELYMRK